MLPDLWTWRVFYDDGTSLDEFDENGVKRGFSIVENDRVVKIHLLPMYEGLPAHTLEINPKEQRPIFFRRRTVELDLNTEEQRLLRTIHCLGWQSTVKGVNVASYTFLFSDGSVLVSPERNCC